MELDRIQEEYREADVGSDIPEEWWKLALAIFGMPVKQDAEAREYVPYGTWGIALLLVFTGVLSMLFLRLMVLLFGFFPVAYDRFWGLTFATSFLVHGGFIHLFGNLYFLLVFGPAAEDALGHRRVAALLLLATVAGNFFHMLGNLNSQAPCIGASGGISGVLAYYALRYPRERIGFLLCFLYYFRWVHVPAYGMFLIWIVIQALATYNQVTGISNVSALSHVGGACTGALFWLVTRKKCPRGRVSRAC
jgi:membrane associated rhomboid family serine protease